MKKFNLDDVKENSKIVDINEVCFNPWNPKVKRSKEYEKVKESVRVNGLSMPIVVREINDDNYKYQVLDGEQRLTAALDLGFDKIWIVDLGEISDEEAKSKTIWMEMAVPFDKEQLGKLLVELVDKVDQLTGVNESVQIDFPSTEFTQKVLTPNEIMISSFDNNLTDDQKVYILTKVDSLDEFKECLNQLCDLAEFNEDEPIISIDDYINNLNKGDIY